MSRLSELKPTISYQLPRAIIYGTPKIGKTTLASQFPKAVVIDLNHGNEGILCVTHPEQIYLFKDLITTINEYRTDPDHSFRTLVVDSLTEIEQMIFTQVCQDHKKSCIEDIGYAKGYKFALSYWLQLIDALDALRSQRSMGIVLVGHSRLEKVDHPELETFKRYVPDVDPLASGLLTRWVDMILFAFHEILLMDEDIGFNKKKHHSRSGRRLLATVEKAAHLAGNRYGLPPIMELDYPSSFPTQLASCIQQRIAEGTPPEPQTPVSELHDYVAQNNTGE
jgi:hypothetical protein